MIKIVRKSELQGAEKYGECIACGTDSSSSGIEIFKIEFESMYGVRNSIRLCRDCAALLSMMLDTETEDLNVIDIHNHVSKFDFEEEYEEI